MAILYESSANQLATTAFTLMSFSLKTVFGSGSLGMRLAVLALFSTFFLKQCLELAWANYGLVAVCGPLSFLIRSTKHEEIILIVMIKLYFMLFSVLEESFQLESFQTVCLGEFSIDSKTHFLHIPLNVFFSNKSGHQSIPSICSCLGPSVQF